MAPFVLLCLNSPNCYALFAVPSTGLMMMITMITMMIRIMMMMMMTSSMTGGCILAERSDEGLWPI